MIKLLARLESMLDAQLLGLREYRAAMDRHQNAIDRLKAESAVITERTDLKLAEIRQMLNTLQR